mgnify:CR=1 FL=1
MHMFALSVFTCVATFTLDIAIRILHTRCLTVALSCLMFLCLQFAKLPRHDASVHGFRLDMLMYSIGRLAAHVRFGNRCHCTQVAPFRELVCEKEHTTSASLRLDHALTLWVDCLEIYDRPATALLLLLLCIWGFDFGSYKPSGAYALAW